MSDMFIGADYYPEHWPRERWETDVKLMREAGFNITRLAEFSWVKLEPEEGKYDFTWLDEAVGLLGRNGIKSILCTPTPTMPKWLYDNYPEVISRDVHGHPLPFGNRQNNCFSSKVYRYFSQKITTALAERYADNPYVAGWQLDNELHDPFCYCENCENAFRRWLKDKFGDVGALNEAYGTIFWSQCYGNFGETHLPRHVSSSPSLYLDFRRFHSELVVSFAKEQTEILRRVCPGHFITHNLMGFHPSIDYYKLGELLDFAAHDYYYSSGEWDNRYGIYAHEAAALDLMRGIKGRNFHIMETNGGPGGWENYTRNMRPGEMRRMAFLNMAHGADGQMWFRWRTCRFGTEQYWHGLLGHDGLPGRRYEEAARTASDMQNVWAQVGGSQILSQAAIIYDYDDIWALTQQSNSQGFDYVRAMLPYHRALLKHGVNVDFINANADLSRYKIVVMPYKYILTEEFAGEIERLVKNGGMLLTTCRSGVKDVHNVPYAMTLPGFLRGAAGLRIEEYEALPESRPYRVHMGTQTFEGKLLADWIIPENAEVLAKYDDGDTGYPAVTRNAYGAGQTYYVGTVPCNGLAGAVISEILANAGVRRFDLPENTEASVRTRDGVDYVYLLNHSSKPQSIAINGIDILTGCAANGELVLEPDGIAVVKLP